MRFLCQVPPIRNFLRFSLGNGDSPRIMGNGDSPRMGSGDSNCKFSRENLSGLSKQTDGYPLRVSAGKR